MAIVHYAAPFAAAGGPAFPANMPSTEGVTYPDVDRAPISIHAYGERWVVADHDGRIFAEAYDPADLILWMTNYLTTLSREVAGDEDDE